MLSKSVVDTLHYSVFVEVVRFELLNLEIMHKCTFTIMDCAFGTGEERH